MHVGVRLAGLAKDDRGDGRDHDERGDDRGEVQGPRPRRERGSGAMVAQRVGEGDSAAGDEEGDIRAGWEEPPERDVARGGHRRVVGEEQEPVRDADRQDDPRVER